MTDMQPYERLAALPIGHNPTGPEDAYTWSALWCYDESNAAPTPAAITEVTHLWSESYEGYADVNVALLARLESGAWAACVAWCDTSGWDCQSGVDWKVSADRDWVIRMGLDKEARARLGLPLPDEQQSPA
ncbi:hypothetical protein ACIPJK_07470 [Streptomyces roseus]|uniref:hypothetical protein n=1 Tax=Streptomyces roseus TaxID=66430 RepID=UPI003808E4E7